MARTAAVLGVVGAFVLGVGCGGGMAPAGAGYRNDDAPLTTVEDAEAAFSRAEAQLGGLGGTGAGGTADAAGAEPLTAPQPGALRADTPANAREDSCQTACGALGSMRRAADRICELAPGDRCDSAAARLGDAEKRVESACPGCST